MFIFVRNSYCIFVRYENKKHFIRHHEPSPVNLLGRECRQNPYYYFRTLDIKDGLSHNTVNTILQDRQGFMWFGTKDGLNQYDGLVFRTFQKENSSLGNNFITALHEDAEGNIWVGTDTGVYIYNPRLEKFTPFDIPIEGTGETISRTITWIDSDPQKTYGFRPIPKGFSTTT